MDEATLKQVWLLRRMVGMISNDQKLHGEGAEKLLERLRKSKTNQDFLSGLSKGV